MTPEWRAVFTRVANDLIYVLGVEETKRVFAEVVRRGPPGGTAGEWSLTVQVVVRERHPEM